MLDIRNKPEIAVSDILSSIVSGLFESETKSKQKNKGKLDPFSLHISFQMETQLKTWNT